MKKVFFCLILLIGIFSSCVDEVSKSRVRVQRTVDSLNSSCPVNLDIIKVKSLRFNHDTITANFALDGTYYPLDIFKAAYVTEKYDMNFLKKIVRVVYSRTIKRLTWWNFRRFYKNYFKLSGKTYKNAEEIKKNCPQYGCDIRKVSVCVADRSVQQQMGSSGFGTRGLWARRTYRRVDRIYDVLEHIASGRSRAVLCCKCRSCCKKGKRGKWVGKLPEMV